MITPELYWVVLCGVQALAGNYGFKVVTIVPTVLLLGSLLLIIDKSFEVWRYSSLRLFWD